MYERIHLPNPPKSVDAEIEYIKSSLTQIETGEVVWMQRNFHSTNETIFDYYSDKVLKAFIKISHLDGYPCHVYRVPSRDHHVAPVQITPEPIAFDQAVTVLLEVALL